MKKLFLSLALILNAALATQGQDNAAGAIEVTGHVADSVSGETIPYATVGAAFAAFADHVSVRRACDGNGRFAIRLDMEGEYIFTFQSVGKRVLVRRFEIPEGKSKVDLGRILMTDNDSLLAEVTVTARRPLVKIDVDKITYNLEDDPEAITSTMLEALRKVPMLTVDGEDKIQLKGADNFKIYLNGKPSSMLSGSNASNVLRSMPASSVKSIEVITDPGPKYDAEGVGGIINIIVARNSLQGYTATVNAEATSLGGYRGSGYLTTKIGKMGLTANYNYIDNRRPWTTYNYVRDQYGTFAGSLSQDGRNRNSGKFRIGFFEANYELDTLTLIRAAVNLYGGDSRTRQEFNAQMTPHTESGQPYAYDLVSESESSINSLETNIDFQRSTSRKDELITVSYRFAREPDYSHSNTRLENEVNYYNGGMYPRRSSNRARAGEHTGQIDYTVPLFGSHTLEAGAKYIVRLNRSDTREEVVNSTPEGDKWIRYVQPTDSFYHTQHIYAGYLAYSLRYKSFSYNAGVRAEGTSLNVSFDEAPDMNFATRYFDVVPSFAASWMMSMASQLRMGYNLRIYRPGIWYLNPYVNQTDPQNISYGNPNLASEKSHSLNLNYSYFAMKFNFNAALNYRLVNNAIERYTFVNRETGVNESTYENVGRNESLNLSLYGRWSPSDLFSLSLNASIYHTSIKNPVRNLSNSGFNGLAFGNAQLNLPSDYVVSVMGQYVTPFVQLQTTSSPYFVNMISVSKTFLNKKLTLSLTAQSPFKRYIRFKSTTTDRDFSAVTINNQHQQEFRLRISYRFGTFKGNIRQIRRGISNDDMKEGGSGD
jgi:hypothetical protein